MLEWIWFGVLLAAMVGLIAWDVHHDMSDGEGSFVRVIVAVLCLLLSLGIKWDLLVSAPYDWLMGVLPEPDTSIHWATAAVLTAGLVIAEIGGTMCSTFFVAEWCSRRMKKRTRG